MDIIIQKQPPRGALKERCSKNMQQIYRRTPMPMCDFNKVAFQPKIPPIIHWRYYDDDELIFWYG